LLQASEFWPRRDLIDDYDDLRMVSRLWGIVGKSDAAASTNCESELPAVVNTNRKRALPIGVAPVIEPAATIVLGDIQIDSTDSGWSNLLQ